MGTAQCRSRLS